MLLSWLKRSSILQKIYTSKIAQYWIEQKVFFVQKHLKKNNNIVDIGCGNAFLTSYLVNQGFCVIGVDVANLSLVPSIQPILYNGINLPFEDKQFDAALLLTVLHHTTSPVDVLKEASRVANQVIIIEDIYSNRIQKYLTYVMDTIVNLGHSSMTYQNKSDKEWKAAFKELDLDLKRAYYKRVLLLFRQAVYILEQKNEINKRYEVSSF